MATGKRVFAVLLCCASNSLQHSTRREPQLTAAGVAAAVLLPLLTRSEAALGFLQLSPLTNQQYQQQSPPTALTSRDE